MKSKRYVARVMLGLGTLTSFSTGNVDFNGIGVGTVVVTFQGFFDVGSSFACVNGFTLQCQEGVFEHS